MGAAQQPMAHGAALALVENFMRAAFAPNSTRSPRSDAYRLGVRELLNSRALVVRLVCPYTMGTAEADAFYSGVDEGNCIWRDHLVAQAKTGT
nr:hypothetical protein [uncultured Massilia sp.]